jgi:transketolase
LGNKATRDHFGDYICDLGKGHNDMLVVGCDLAGATRSVDFKKEFPDRYIECGISEANAISIAAGLSLEGFRPFVCSFGHFLTGKWLEIFQSIGLNNTGVVLVGTHAGLAIGKDGPTQMGLRDVGLMKLLPNIEIIHPIDKYETIAAMEYSATTRHPIYLRLCRQPVNEYHTSSYKFKSKKIDKLRDGPHCLIIGHGGTLEPIMQAAQKLEVEKNLSVSVINISSFPYDDLGLLDAIKSHEKILVVEDHFHRGGIFDEIVKSLYANKKLVDLKHIAVKDYAQAADPKDLYSHYQMDEHNLFNLISQWN